MNMTDNFLQNNNLRDGDDIDSLLELADLLRQLLTDAQYSDVSRLIGYTVEHSYYEAFSWCMGIVQEAFEDKGRNLSDFSCTLGKSIPDYDAFAETLQVDFSRPTNDTRTICDQNGEVTSFFNILTYRTGYENIHLVSCENFDTKDNDYIQYKLLFSRN